MSNSTPAAGWYPDPAGSPQQRWWNGTTWSESTQATPTASPYGNVQPYGATEAYVPMQNYGQGQQQSYYGQTLRAPEGTDPTTSQAWLIALWPLLGALNAVVFAALGGYSYTSLEASTSLRAIDGFSYLLTFLAWVLLPVVAYFDSSELRRRGVPRPFGWGWAFIPIVYNIGRAVTVYSRTGKGLAPLFVWIGAGAVDIVIAVAVVFTSVYSSGLYN